jgi:F-type H+-transporting ATPase subunit b
MSLLAVSNLNASASFAEGAVNVDFDASLFVSFVLFIGLLIVLKPLLFDPMMKLFDERERLIDRKLRDGVELDKKSAEALAKYERILAKAREAGAAERDKLRAEGAKKENELLGEVRSQTATTLEQGRGATAKEADAARQALKGEAQGLGRAIASRVLGREVTS